MLDVLTDELLVVSSVDEVTHEPSLDIIFSLGPFDLLDFVSITGTCNILVNKFVMVGFVNPSFM